MGQLKHEMDMRETNWDRKAAAERLKCSRCSTTIPYGDRDVFYRSGYCGYCVAVVARDD
jgi:hypothetical protein